MTSFNRIAVACGVALFLSCPGFVSGSEFSQSHLKLAAVANNARGEVEEARRVGFLASVEMELEQSLHETLEVERYGGDARADAIEASIWRAFQALPKNKQGRLSPRSVRYLAHQYFAREHGWLISGLEPHGHQANVSEVHEVNLLQDKAPAVVEALLEARQANRGLALRDVVVMIGTLERLIFDESAELLQAAYKLNGLNPGDRVDQATLHQLLSSYLLLFEMGSRRNLTDVAGHQYIKAKAEAIGGAWATLVTFESDAVLNQAYSERRVRNPFVERTYSFMEAAHIVDNLAQTYGKWQNTECVRMKDDLVELSPDGTGRVPLRVFYSSNQDHADYQFWESQDYLRAIGAIDEASKSVRIANYLNGPSNCIASSSYYSVCCMNECDILMEELMGKVQAPVASAEHLLKLVANISSSTVDAPRVLPKHLTSKLQEVADRHGGDVPLHGRLFAQWLHLAFPNECPYPHITEDSSVLTVRNWAEGGSTASPAERERIVQELSTEGEQPLADHAGAWTEEEVLPLLEPNRRHLPSIRSMLYACIQLGMFVAVLRVGLGAWRAACAAASPEGACKPGKGKQDGYAFHFDSSV